MGSRCGIKIGWRLGALMLWSVMAEEQHININYSFNRWILLVTVDNMISVVIHVVSLDVAGTHVVRTKHTQIVL